VPRGSRAFSGSRFLATTWLGKLKDPSDVERDRPRGKRARGTPQEPMGTGRDPRGQDRTRSRAREGGAVPRDRQRRQDLPDQPGEVDPWNG
jgi:hypothetical protein